MSSESWLRLSDYASKYQISVSTLRRRIKNGDIKYRFDQGKYLIFAEAPPVAEPESPSQIQGDDRERIVDELKRAYRNALHEKEEQLIQLKREVVDLKTLVRVLEEDNERLRRGLPRTTNI